MLLILLRRDSAPEPRGAREGRLAEEGERGVRGDAIAVSSLSRNLSARKVGGKGAF